MNNERNRAWRRFKNRVNARKGQGSQSIHKPEKKWKMMYLRSNKLLRAKQLGFEYPRISPRRLLEKQGTDHE